MRRAADHPLSVCTAVAELQKDSDVWNRRVMPEPGYRPAAVSVSGNLRGWTNVSTESTREHARMGPGTCPYGQATELWTTTTDRCTARAARSLTTRGGPYRGGPLLLTDVDQVDAWEVAVRIRTDRRAWQAGP